MAKKVTLDDLAGMVKKGFDGVDEKFEGVNKKLDHHAEENKKEFSEVKKELKRVRVSISNLEFIATEMVRRYEFLELKRKVEMLEAKIV